VRRSVHAEWTKLRTTSAPAWLFAAIIALTVAVSAIASASVHAQSSPGQDPVRLALIGVDLGQAVVAGLAVLIVCGEYATGMIHTTFLTVPRRLKVLAAKAGVLASAVLLAGIAAVGASLLIGRSTLDANGFTTASGYRLISLGDGPTLRAAAGTVLYLILIGLLSLGVATAVRDSTTAIGIVLGLLYLFPLLTALVGNPDWHKRLEQISPTNAGQSIEATTNLHHLALSPWNGLGVLAAWTTAALLVGGTLLVRRDA
jgi:ABC-2 type transport system permease protein